MVAGWDGNTAIRREGENMMGIFHIPPEDPPACPKCAALEVEIARLREALNTANETARALAFERDDIQQERDAKSALLRELAAAVREFYGDPQEAAFDTPETARINEVLRRAEAEAGEAK